jgi:pyruvate dehydrogenase E2 component (dihydrolipoamide acetyltransferase)
MAVKVEMPKLSDTQDSGTLASWNVSEGDKVESGDVVAEVETDKATMDVEVYDSGTILKILIDEGTTVPLGGLMAVIGEEGEDISDILEEAGNGSSQNGEKDEEDEESEENAEEKEDQEKDENGESEQKESSEEETSEDESEEKEESSSSEQQSSSSQNGRIKASPLARNMAEDQGIDLSNVEGSGPGGRIIKRDIESFKTEEPEVQTGRQDQEIDVSQMRKTIARRLSESKYSRPHYYETVDIKAKGLIEARAQINDMIEGKISFNDLVVKACASALRNHPMVNVSWQEDTILQHGDINIAIAVAIDEGLITPVINHADQKGLEQISKESKELAEKARNRDLSNEQLQGSTFTISNLGMFGIEEFTAIINPPNSSILAVGAIREAPVIEDGEVVPGKRMKITLSSDHRVVDGATAAQFLQTLRNMLETPLSMLL